MIFCRICLTGNPEKDIRDLETALKGERTTYIHVMRFCLNVQVTDDTNTTRKLCKKCFNKTLRYYEFKTLALQSDAYLQSLSFTLNVSVKNNKYVKANESNYNFISKYNNSQETKTEMIELKTEECQKVKVKHESDLKLIEDTTENVPAKKHYHKVKTKRNVTPQIFKDCGKTVKSIKEHVKAHTSLPEEATLSCNACSKLFTAKYALMKHQRLEHNIDVSESCDICNKVVKNLKIHQRVAHNKSSLCHICPSCDKRFISRSVLDAHMATHMTDRPFECELCDGKFKTKILMAEHIRQVHNKERPHLCQFCSKTFYKGHHLKVHIRTHTKEKPYKCDDCSKTFLSIPALNKHKMVHSNVKNYACTICNKTFARNCYLSHHMQSHNQEKRHACKYCGAMFGRSDNRKRHEILAHERHLNDC